MRPEKKYLGGGVTLFSLKTDKFKTDSLSLNFVMPLKRETVTRVSLLRGLLLRGSQGYPDFESLSARTEELYGTEISVDTHICGDCLVLSFSASFLKERFSVDGTKIREGVCELLRRICFFPVTDNGAFLSEYCESEKKRLKSEIEAQKNDKGSYSALRLAEAMFPQGAASVSKYGYTEYLDEINARNEYIFYKHIVSSCPVFAYAVGDMELEEAENAILTIFEGVARDCTESAEAHLADPVHITEPATVIENMDVKQGRLAMGYCTAALMSASAEYTDTLIVNEILGMSPISKLFMHVREELNLCYSCHSHYSASYGTLAIFAGIDPQSFEKTRDACDEMLDKIRRGDFDEGELEIAKKSIISNIRATMDSPRLIMDFYLTRELYSIEDSYEDIAERILSATREDVCRAAGKIKLHTVYFLTNCKAETEVAE